MSVVAEKVQKESEKKSTIDGINFASFMGMG
jgi:hypothetical protein